MFLAAPEAVESDVMMTRREVAGVGLWIVTACGAAAGQERNQEPASPPTPAAVTAVRTYPAGGLLPWRHAVTRTSFGGSDVVTGTIEIPDIDGRMSRTEEIVTTTTPACTRRDVFGFSASGQRVLRQASVAAHQILAGGAIRTVQETSVADLNGRLALASREIEQTTDSSPGVRETDTVVFRRGIDGRLQQVEHIRQREQEALPGVLRRESVLSVRTVNGRFEPTESRIRETRTLGPSESVEEETMRRRNLNGAWIVAERHVTHRFEGNGLVRTIIDTFDQTSLIRRVERTTTATADDGRRTVEEVETPAPGSSSEPIRLARLTVEVTRKVDSAHWEMERQVFDRDVNGRLVLTIKDIEKATVE
jgi:hypothetical protein